MTCTNLVPYYIPRGYDYRKVEVRCGNTDHHGDRAVCDDCASDPIISARIASEEANIAADNAWAHSAGYGDY